MHVRYDMVNCFVVRPDALGRGHEFLQLRRCGDDLMGGTWQTVYGQSHPEETAPEAALRELREETGLAPSEFYCLERVGIFYVLEQDTLWHCVQFCAIVKRSDGVVLNPENDALRWIAAEQAERYFMWQENRQAVREILGEILGGGPAKPHERIPLPPPGS